MVSSHDHALSPNPSAPILRKRIGNTFGLWAPRTPSLQATAQLPSQDPLLKCGRNMELRHLRYFVAVAEELNFTKAAEKLRLAQPSLTRQIHNLEEELGVRLLNRTKNQVSLTE